LTEGFVAICGLGWLLRWDRMGGAGTPFRTALALALVGCAALALVLGGRWLLSRTRFRASGHWLYPGPGRSTVAAFIVFYR